MSSDYQKSTEPGTVSGASGSVPSAERESGIIESVPGAVNPKPPEKGIGKHPPGHQCSWCDRIRKQVAGAAEKQAKGLPVTRQRLKPKQRSFIKHYTNPNSPGFGRPKQAAILAGQPSDQASDWALQTLQKQSIQSAMVRALEARGITDEFIAGKLLDGMNATITSRVKYEGAFTDERVDADQHARAKFTEMTLRLKGSFPRESEIESGAIVVRVPAGQDVAVAVRGKGSQNDER